MAHSALVQEFKVAQVTITETSPVCILTSRTRRPCTMPHKDKSARLQSIYCVSHCYNAPLPDDRKAKLTVLSLNSSADSLTSVQQIELPKETLMPVSQVINQEGTKLFTVAGKHGILCYELKPDEQGRIIDKPNCLNVTLESLQTPYGVMPVDLSLDVSERKLFTCNFLAGSISELSLNSDGQLSRDPRVCVLAHPGVPEKVQEIGLSSAAKELGFPEGFPEDSSHPHGVACHPDGKWVVFCDLGSSNLMVFSLPLGESFESGEPDFVMAAHLAPDNNRHYLAGTRLVRFSPNGDFLFSVNELDHTISSYRFNAVKGTLVPCGQPCMTVPQDWLDGIPPRPYMYNSQPNYNSGLAVSPDGRHVYSSARGHDSVAGFVIHADGTLVPTSQKRVGSGGRTPWSMTFVNNDYLLVANQNADDPMARQQGGKHADPERIAPAGREPGNLTVFKRDSETGSLHPTGAIWEAPHIISVQTVSQ